MNDSQWMRRALELARAALGATAPNPAVGAVIVRDDVVLGEGWTRPVGREHAEIVALADARARGMDLHGATLYVTLEPCCHHGRTPPCTDALIAAGVGRVVAGVLDPYPAMRGTSLELLRAEGIEVVLGVEAEACARQILGFARAQMAGLPEVSCKAAVSADGHLATASGESKWITGPLARQDGHQLRAGHDALLVGLGTALADDPRLTCRLSADDRRAARGLDAHPVPVVWDTSLRLPADARLLSGPRRAVVLCGTDAPERALEADVVRVDVGPDGRVDPVAGLEALAARGLHRVLVEGGAETHRTLLGAGLVDTLFLYVAGLLLPGGRSWVGGPPVAALSEGVRMELVDACRVGPDARLTFHLPHEHAPDPLAALLQGGRVTPGMRTGGRR